MSVAPLPSAKVRELAPIVLEVLRAESKRDGPAVSLNRLRISVDGASRSQLGLVIAWLRRCGAPISVGRRGEGGYTLTNTDWQLPGGPLVHVEITHTTRLVDAAGREIADQLYAATSGDLLAELERRGWEVKATRRWDLKPQPIVGRLTDTTEGAHREIGTTDVWRQPSRHRFAGRAAVRSHEISV